MSKDESEADSTIIMSSRDHFVDMVNSAIEKRGVRTLPIVRGYLVDLLVYYVPTSNLFDVFDSSGKRSKETLAEMFLKANSADNLERIELLKKLADRSLYISGFFGDSLQKQLVDIDYYADMGCSAYDALAESVREDTLAKVYRVFAKRFFDFVEVLSFISSASKLQNEENIMRLYEVYAKTGSDLAREKLMAKGLIAVPVPKAPMKRQQ